MRLLSLSLSDSVKLVTGNTLLKSGLWLSFMATLVQIQTTMALTLSLAYAIILKRFPAVIASYFGGQIADKYSAKNTVTWVVLFTGLVSYALSTLNFDDISYYPWLLLAYTAISAGEGVFKPALQALNARQHGQNTRLLRQTNTWINATSMLTIVVMGALGAYLHIFMSVSSIFFLSALLVVLSLFFFLSIQENSLAVLNPADAPAWIPDTQTLHELAKLPAVRLSFIATTILGLSYAFFTLIVTKFPFEVYHNNQTGVAVSNLIVGVGILSGVGLLHLMRTKDILPDGKNPYFAVYFLLFLSGALLAIFSSITDFNLAMLLFFAVVLFYGLLKVYAENQLVLSVPSEKTGRMFAFLYITEEFAITPALLIYAYHCQFQSIQNIGFTVGEFIMLSSLILIFLRLEQPSNLVSRIPIMLRYRFGALLLLALLLMNGLLSIPHVKAETPIIKDRIESAIEKIESQVLSWQTSEGYWWLPAHQGTYYVSQYFILLKNSGYTDPQFDEKKLEKEILASELSQGGWDHLPLFENREAELNPSLVNYWALKLMGYSENSDVLKRAKKQILALGGAEKAEPAVQILMALYGQQKWSVLPKVANAFFNGDSPINYSQYAPWVAPAMYGVNYLRKRELVLPSLYPEQNQLAEVFNDKRDQVYKPGGQENFDQSMISGLLQSHGDYGLWAMSAAATAINIVALEDYLQVASQRKKNRIQDVLKRARKRISDLYFATGSASYKGVTFGGRYWDTLIFLKALTFGKKYSELSPEIRKGIDYLLASQHQVDGSFIYGLDTKEYPDLDDTAFAATLLGEIGGFSQQAHQALTWMGKLQDKSGAWSSFSQGRYGNWLLKFLSSLFTEESVLFDQLCPDVTAHVIEAYAVNGMDRDRSTVVSKAIDYLKGEQSSLGTWRGCWGINHVYGSSSVVTALLAAGEDPQSPMLTQTVDWLESIIKEDGGVGESAHSYSDPQWIGKGLSTPSQSAWTLQALVAAGRARDPKAQAIVNYLLRQFEETGSLTDPVATGTGVGGVSYIVYPAYAPGFSLLALKQYVGALSK